MIKLAQPYIPEESFELVKQVFDSGNLIQGTFVKRFEEMVAKYLDVLHTFMVSSGTAALHLAMIALDIKKGMK